MALGSPTSRPAPPRGPRPKAPPPKRGGPGAAKQLIALGCVLAGAVVILAGTWAYASRLHTIAAEKLLIVALFSRIPVVQKVAAKAMPQYPTKHAAVALVLFVNLKNLQEMPPKDETPADKAKRLQRRKRDLALADRAMYSLCVMTGQSFGSYYKREPYGHSWGSLSEEQWPKVLWQMNGWAAETLAGVRLPILDLLLPAATPAPAGQPGRSTP